jgi:hypothetical protein
MSNPAIANRDIPIGAKIYYRMGRIHQAIVTGSPFTGDMGQLSYEVKPLGKRRSKKSTGENRTIAIRAGLIVKWEKPS